MKTLPASIARLIAVVASTVCGTALAQPMKLQPGLWEQTMTMKTASGEMEAKMAQMQQQMANMPPEQRKMVEDMMARQGVGMSGSGRNTTIRMCISAEQAERAEMPQHEGNCKQEMLERSGGTVRYKFSCTGEHPTSGEGEYTMTNPNSYSGKASVLTQVKGKPEKIDMTTNGRWVSADCGAIKPRVTKP
ncbi:MAG TPA: DUF3617 domain-containing protein [Ideonella sp.]|jgi:hypothetical protein|nr:DUF3617 domain-containing protein [Ideonella sp.]